MWEKFVEFFAEGTIARYILDGYLLFVIVFFVLWFALKSKHFLSIVLPLLIFGVFCFLAIALDLKISGQIYKYILIALPILFVIVMAPDIHNWLDTAWQKDQSSKYVKFWLYHISSSF